MAGESDADSREFEAAWEDFILAARRAQARGQASKGELTLAQYYLLLPLLDGGSLPLSRLAQSTGVAAPTATRIVDGLEQAGLARRGRSMADRRTVFVSLTREGRRHVKRKRESIARRRRRLYAALEPAERRQAERILRHLTELLRKL
jgi:DNA-binding MarR family transcriptional regulator